MLTEQNAHLNNYILSLCEENENLQMKIQDLKTSLDQNKQMFDEYINQKEREKNNESDEPPESARMPLP